MRAGVYSLNDQIQSTFTFLKSAKNLSEARNRDIEITYSDSDSEVLGYLTPVGTFHANDNTLINTLSDWRKANKNYYPTRFEVTTSGTANWLRNEIINNPNRLMFILSDGHGNLISYVGISILKDYVCEIESVTQIDSKNDKLINGAINKTERFIYDELGFETIQTRVLKSNSNNVDNFLQNNYVVVNEIPLAKSGTDTEFKLIESDEGIFDYYVLLEKNLVDAQPLSNQILTAGPSISSRELSYVSEATKYGWNNKHSDFLNKFQLDFANYVGAEYALATSSCTGALHLALLALGIGPGDEVIVPEVTWVATASAVRYVGATPVFADIDSETWCIDPKSIEQKISQKTKAIMPVHLYGFGAQMTAISEIAKAHNLKIVEDAAPAIGTLIDGKPAGSFGDFGAYSFQGAKMLVTGEGGMLVTSNQELYERARKIQDHGRRPGTFWIEELGYKYKMNNITAALGLAQLERSERQIEQKRRIADWYRDFLGNTPLLTMQMEKSNTRSIHWMNSITLSENLPIARDEMMEKLKAEGIDTRPVFPAISQYPMWDKNHEPGEVATRIGAQSINLPSGVKLSKKSVAKVCEVINSLIG